MKKIHSHIIALLLASLFSFATVGAETRGSRPPAPDFELRDLNGVPHKLSEMRGSVVLINFWATWCPPCRAEMPALQRAWDQLRGPDFKMIAIAVGESPAKVFDFFFSSGTSYTFDFLADVDSKVSEDWPLKGLPTTFIVDKSGRVVYKVHGPRAWDRPDFTSAIRQLMSESEVKPNTSDVSRLRETKSVPPPRSVKHN